MMMVDSNTIAVAEGPELSAQAKELSESTRSLRHSSEDENMNAEHASHAPIGRTGIWSLELSGHDHAEVAEAAAELDEAGSGALWIAGAAGGGLWDNADRLLAATRRISVALGVASIWGPDAQVAPERFEHLSGKHGRRLLAGFGVSTPRSAIAAGKPFGSPLRAMNDYLDILDSAVPPLPQYDRLLGALGPRMVELATRRAAGIHPFLVTPDSNLANRAILGPDAVLAPHQAVVLEEDPARAREVARNGIGIFIGLPSYQANLRRQGFDDVDLVPGGSDRLIDATVAWGTAEDIAHRIRAHHDAGADHVAIQVLIDQRELPRAQWRTLSELLARQP
jgi:probable F420-dependent oxidoreductase